MITRFSNNFTNTKCKNSKFVSYIFLVFFFSVVLYAHDRSYKDFLVVYYIRMLFFVIACFGFLFFVAFFICLRFFLYTLNICVDVIFVICHRMFFFTLYFCKLQTKSEREKERTTTATTTHVITS